MTKKTKDRAAVMFSGGLDSRLVVKLMQKKGHNVTALYFKLPFSKDVGNEIRKFCKKQKVKLKIFDYTKGKLLKEYISLLKKPKFGRGSGVNPCIDCRAFMLDKARKFAKRNKIDIIATGEVLGQRPMSQHKRGLEIVKKESKLNEKLVRPLLELGIKGRTRGKQISMAKKFKIDYPNPAGGCLLCEKQLSPRFKHLINRGLNKDEVKLVSIGRHFLIDKCWVVLGRNEKENNIIEKIGNKSNLVIPEDIGPSGIILDKCSAKIKSKVKKLVKAYSKGSDVKERRKFQKYVL